MTDGCDDQSLFHDGLYKKAISEIGTLKEKLPEAAFASLAREVIRRLSDHSSVVSASIAFPSDTIIEELTRALMEPDPEVGIAFVECIRSQGASVETVYLAYLAEAAKTLGLWWEEDKITFSDVTVASGHIYAVMRGLKPIFRSPEPLIEQPSAFFTSVPGETHLLGISMATDLFRKKGWDIMFKRDLEHDEIVHYAATSRLPLIGLSAAGEHALVPLAKLVIALRVSVPEASIMVSGAILQTSYDSVESMGVEILPCSMDDALVQARDAWDQTARQWQVG